MEGFLAVGIGKRKSRIQVDRSCRKKKKKKELGNCGRCKVPSRKLVIGAELLAARAPN